ncbi:MAG: MBL fold metallo-hydrolase [Candidatus Magnetoovum sp. WYHC-5]|nr:MBL fold metallo-hydrolase [Candidatus Magnetoovum sp. WYHC-5]
MMKVKFWGVRGSIPSPGKHTARYGGNTSCIELYGEDGTLVIFDAGTGIRSLGDHLLTLPPSDIHLFLTHTHWDHIHGFPFFRPAYRQNLPLNIYGPYNSEKTIRETLTLQMIYSVFPVHVDELEAEIVFHNINEDLIKVGNLSIKPRKMNHPITCFGYKVEENGKYIFYTGDHEQFFEFRNTEGGTKLAQKYEGTVKEERAEGEVDFVKGVDLLIADSQYLEEEYVEKAGYGHSTVSQTLDLAIKAQVKHLVLFHHEPVRSDDALDNILEMVKQKAIQEGSPDMKITIAEEGIEINV